MDVVAFIIKYTPFWAIPCSMISVTYGYIYWLKSYKHIAYFFLFVGFISFIFSVFYYWAGGPEKAVQFFMNHIGHKWQ